MTDTPPDGSPPAGDRDDGDEPGSVAEPVGAGRVAGSPTGSEAGPEAGSRTASEADEVSRSASLSPTERVIPTWTDPTVAPGQRPDRRADGAARAGRPEPDHHPVAGVPADGDRHPDLRLAVQGRLHPAGPERPGGVVSTRAGSGRGSPPATTMPSRSTAATSWTSAPCRTSQSWQDNGETRYMEYPVRHRVLDVGGRPASRAATSRSPRPPGCCRCRWTSPPTSPSARSFWA